MEGQDNPEVNVDLLGVNVEEQVRHFSFSEEQKSPNPTYFRNHWACFVSDYAAIQFISKHLMAKRVVFILKIQT